MPPIREGRSATIASRQLSDADSKGRHNTRARPSLQVGADRFLTFAPMIETRPKCGVCHVENRASSGRYATCRSVGSCRTGQTNLSRVPAGPIHLFPPMNRPSSQQKHRRTPAMGVGGFTLLMLVTMVLTTSPVLGRASEASLADFGRAERSSVRAQSGAQTGQRVSGRKLTAPRQVRPFGQCLSAVSRGIVGSLNPARTAVHPRVERTMWPPADVVRVSLLNLPPPLA